MKLTYEDVKNIVSSHGLRLESLEYVNSRTPIVVRCSKDHVYSVLISNIRAGSSCSKCSLEKRRISTIDITYGVEAAGFSVLSVEHPSKGASRVLVKCPKGHISNATAFRFLHKPRCMMCSGRQRKGLGEVTKLVEKDGYELLSANYRCNKEYLFLRCPVGHEYKTKWNTFQQGCRCPECGKEKVRQLAVSKRKNFEDIKKEFAEENYTVLSSEYKDATTKIDCICSKGHRFFSSWGKFSSGKRCPECSGGPVSKISQQWLDSLNIPKENREVTICCGDKKFRVDGFDPKTNTVYEFLGDYWHGNPEVYDAAALHREVKKTFGELHSKTLIRLETMRSSGYNVVSIWEKDFYSAQNK